MGRSGARQSASERSGRDDLGWGQSPLRGQAHSDGQLGVSALGGGAFTRKVGRASASKKWPLRRPRRALSSSRPSWLPTAAEHSTRCWRWLRELPAAAVTIAATRVYPIRWPQEPPTAQQFWGGMNTLRPGRSVRRRKHQHQQPHPPPHAKASRMCLRCALGWVGEGEAPCAHLEVGQSAAVRRRLAQQ